MDHKAFIAWEWTRPDPRLDYWRFAVTFPCGKSSLLISFGGRVRVDLGAVADLSGSPWWKRVPFDRVLEALR